MIIHLKKYKEHGYFKALWLIFLKVFIHSKYKLIQESNISGSFSAHLKYPDKKLDFEGHWKCTSCYLCSDICPSSCIHITGEKNREQLSEGKCPKSFVINLKNCTQCKLCVDVCPTESLGFDGQYEDISFKDGINLLESMPK